MNKDTLIKVVNKYNGVVGYSVPDLGVERNFYPGESKDITFNELQRLSFTPGGLPILKDYLEIKDTQAIMALFGREPEPEYHYTLNDIKEIMISGSLDQFLDCLDFAPAAVRDSIKDLAVDLPLNDVAKRDAILEKLGFNVTRAIEIKNTKLDGGDDDASMNRKASTTRRAAPITKTAAPTGRRYKPEK